MNQQHKIIVKSGIVYQLNVILYLVQNQLFKNGNQQKQKRE